MFRHLQRICGFFQILNILLRTFKKKCSILYKKKLQLKFFPEAVIFSFNFDIIGNIKWHQVNLKRTRHKVTFGLISTLLRSSNCINSNRFMNTKKNFYGNHTERKRLAKTFTKGRVLFLNNNKITGQMYLSKCIY